MRSFTYKAKKGPSEVVEGRIYASNSQEAVDKLIGKGFVPTSVSEEKSVEKGKKTSFDLRAALGVRLKDLITFSKQLSRLIKAGLPILRALDVLQEQTNDAYFKSVIKDIAENVKNGYNLSAALGAYPRVFSPFFRALISAGESSGALYTALERISLHYSKKYELSSKVRSAMAYPMLILVVGILTLVFIFSNVIPRVIPMITNLNAELPWPTKMLIALSDYFSHNWFWLCLGIVIFSLILNRALKNKVFKYYFSRAKLNFPVLGEVVLKSEIAQFSNAMAMALKSGIPLISAANISLPVLNEYGIIDDVKTGLNVLEAGGSFGDALKKSKVFPPFAYNLVKIGEESGDLEDALVNITDAYEADCGEAVKTLTNLLEPVMVLTVGIIVGFIIIAVLLPILNLNIIKV